MLMLFCLFIFNLLYYANCQISCVEPPSTVGGPIGIEYVGTQSTSDNGPCAAWSTASGNINYKTDSQFPDITVQSAQNYCRNPKSPLGEYAPRPWCWLQNNQNTFGYCTIPSCQGICRNTYLGDSYTGTLSTTITGKTCQAWSGQWQTTWPIPTETKTAASNYCRNPNNSSFGLWCYVNGPPITWEPCMAPVCKSTRDCVNNLVPYTFKSLTTTEQYLESCIPWKDILPSYNSIPPPTSNNSTNVIPPFNPALLPDDSFDSSSNFCRNPDNDKSGGWCYVKDGTNFIKKYCKTPCSGIWACLYDRVGQYYQGKVSVTENNVPCLRWTDASVKHTDDKYPDGNASAAANYCRNPTSSLGGPWCYTSTSFGYCNIPSCQQTPPLPPLTTSTNKSNCQLTATGVEYTGTISITKSSATCQSWNLNTPNDNPYFNRPILFNVATMSEASNYCRNPSLDPQGPWCYKSNGGGKEYCSIPQCFTTTVTPPTRNNCRTTLAGTEYTGTVSTAGDGTPCLFWTAITTPIYNNSDFSDGSKQNSANYCRNFVGSDFKGPYCFVVDSTGNPERKGCIVPMCTTYNCRNSVEGYSYSGTKSTTKSGKICLAWNTLPATTYDVLYFPDSSLLAASNFCRNPTATADYDGPFCYTSATTAETCGINYCQTQCRNTANGQDYSGIINYGNKLPCRLWNDASNINFRNPTQLNAVSLDAASNYCRNPDADPAGAWCYTSPQTKSYCSIPVCYPTVTCYTQNNAWTYTGTTNVTVSGLACLNWAEYTNPPYAAPTFVATLLPDDSQNFCRTPSNDSTVNIKPWCFLKDPIVNGTDLITFGYCNVPVCTYCYTFANVSRYNGFVSTTTDGTPCLPWSSLNTTELSKLSGPTFVPSLLVDGSVTSASNYCRVATADPAYVSQPWCYVSSSSTISKSLGQNFGYCSVTFCPTNSTIAPTTTLGTIFMNFIVVFTIAITTFSLTSSTITVLELKTNLLSEIKDNIVSSKTSNVDRPLPTEPINEDFATPIKATMMNNAPPAGFQANEAYSGNMSNAEVMGFGNSQVESISATQNLQTFNQALPSGSPFREINFGIDVVDSVVINENIKESATNVAYSSPKIIGTEYSNTYSLAVSSNIEPPQNVTMPGVVKIGQGSNFIIKEIYDNQVPIYANQEAKIAGHGISTISKGVVYGEKEFNIVGQGSDFAGQNEGYGGQGASIVGQGSGFGYGGKGEGFGGQGFSIVGQESGFAKQSGGYGGQGSGFGGYGEQGANIAGQGSGFGYGGQGFSIIGQGSGSVGQSGGYGGQEANIIGQGSGFTGQGGNSGGQGFRIVEQGSGFAGQSGGYGGQGFSIVEQGSGFTGQSRGYGGQGANIVGQGLSGGSENQNVSFGDTNKNNESVERRNNIYYDINLSDISAPSIGRQQETIGMSNIEARENNSGSQNLFITSSRTTAETSLNNSDQIISQQMNDSQNQSRFNSGNEGSSREANNVRSNNEFKDNGLYSILDDWNRYDN